MLDEEDKMTTSRNAWSESSVLQLGCPCNEAHPLRAVTRLEGRLMATLWGEERSRRLLPATMSRGRVFRG